MNANTLYEMSHEIHLHTNGDERRSQLKDDDGNDGKKCLLFFFYKLIMIFINTKCHRFTYFFILSTTSYFSYLIFYNRYYNLLLIREKIFCKSLMTLLFLKFKFLMETIDILALKNMNTNY